MSTATRTLTAALPEQFRLPSYRLRVLDGPASGTQGSIDRRLAYVGSAPDNDVVVDDVAVSRTHLKIEGTPQGYRITDLGSKNGVWLAGARVTEATLTQDTTLRLGQTQVAFELLQDEHEVSLSREHKFGRLLGRSNEMREIFALLARVAPSEATTLVQGESGTGKELVAEAIHQHSRRSSKPFVIFDCSAVQHSLIESELFGHVKGAYTGALSDRAGAFSQANGGTLFLDEVGELPLDLQPKLLRALDNGEIRAVGANRREKVSVRVVAATNRDLRAMVADGHFREDLYYRLNVVHIGLPPLRRRPDDIPMLVDYFLDEIVRRDAMRPLTVSFQTMIQLQRHGWPGNVRELRNHVERAVLLSQGDQLEVVLEPSRASEDGATPGASAELSTRYDLPFKDAKARLVEGFEQAYWRELLIRHHWNISAAARAGGIHRKSLEYLLKKIDLQRPAETG